MVKRRRRRKHLKSGKSLTAFLVTFFIVTVSGLIAYAVIEDRPQDVPWTELQLDQPVGYFTGRKLNGLAGKYQKCQQLLDAVDVTYQPFPKTGLNQCRRDENINLLTPAAGKISLKPSNLAPSCPVVAALAVWENQVVQPAAIEIFGQKVASIRHLGSYNCRKMAGTNSWSEHATGNAIDIAAFVLEDGQTISLINHWEGDNPKANFLKQIKEESCDLFATVLSPDYNAAHADHFHFDQASRGGLGYRLCR